MPLFPAKREVFAWIKDGRKTIDVRKGKACRGEIAVFQSGPRYMRLQIIRKAHRNYQNGQLQASYSFS